MEIIFTINIYLQKNPYSFTKFSTMKKNSSFIIALTISFFVISCKKEDKKTATSVTTPTTNTTTACGAAMCFTDDGTAVIADSANATLYTNTVSHQRVIDVYAFKGGSQVMEMHFLPKTGSQVVDTSLSFTTAWLTVQTPTDFCDGHSGVFNLTTCDTIANTIKGTFSFSGNMAMGHMVKAITNGSINITKITKQ